MTDELDSRRHGLVAELMRIGLELLDAREGPVAVLDGRGEHVGGFIEQQRDRLAQLAL